MDTDYLLWMAIFFTGSFIWDTIMGLLDGEAPTLGFLIWWKVGFYGALFNWIGFFIL